MGAGSGAGVGVGVGVGSGPEEGGAGVGVGSELTLLIPAPDEGPRRFPLPEESQAEASNAAPTTSVPQTPTVPKARSVMAHLPLSDA